MPIPNEILLIIIEKIVIGHNYDDTKYMIQISQFFKYHYNRLKYKKAMGITKKYMKNIRCDMLYNKSNTFDCIKTIIIDNGNLNNIFKHTNAEITNKNIREIQLPSYIEEYEAIYNTVTQCYTNKKDINILTYDVIQSIIIRGKNIKRVVIGLPHDTIIDHHYNNSDMVTIYLSKNGLYSYLLLYSYGINFIHIYADRCKKIYTYGKYFDNYTHLRDILFRAINETPYKFSKLELDVYRHHILS